MTTVSKKNTKTTKTTKITKVKKTTKTKKVTKTKKPKVETSSKEKVKKIVIPSKKEKPTRAGEKGKGDGKVVLRIRVRAYESKILDASVKQIMDTAMRYDAIIVGPVPLPTEIKKYTVNRSAFIYKDAREQFEIRVHKRLIDIINPNAKTIDALTNLSLPSGVDIDVKMM